MIRKVAIGYSMVVLVWASAFSLGYAQKGTGEPRGVGRKADKPAVVSVTGELKEVSTHPCEQTTGKGELGTHLILKTKDKELNLHLGPATNVKDVVEIVKVGRAVAARAFRTEKMPKNHYNAVSITVDGKTVVLRDDALRPRWARRMIAKVPSKVQAVAAKLSEVKTQEVVVHLSHFTDDLHPCFMALKLANLMQEHDAAVTIFLDLEGVRLAERRQLLDMTWDSSSATLADLYESFVDGGGKIVLCPHCAKSARIGDLALKRNANIGTMEQIGGLLIEADKILDY